jgi:hypothetical protein
MTITSTIAISIQPGTQASNGCDAILNSKLFIGSLSESTKSGTCRSIVHLTSLNAPSLRAVMKNHWRESGFRQKRPASAGIIGTEDGRQNDETFYFTAAD